MRAPDPAKTLKFAGDSPLEGGGFELPVPDQKVAASGERQRGQALLNVPYAAGTRTQHCFHNSGRFERVLLAITGVVSKKCQSTLRSPPVRGREAGPRLRISALLLTKPSTNHPAYLKPTDRGYLAPVRVGVSRRPPLSISRMRRSPPSLSQGHAPGPIVDPTGGVFQVGEDEPAPRVGAGLNRPP